MRSPYIPKYHANANAVFPPDKYKTVKFAVMNNPEKKPLLLPALLSMKCPNCRKGFVFQNKSIFPLGKTVTLKNNCEICGQKLQSEKNNGAGMNYALTVIIFFLNLCWYAPLYIYISNPKIHWYEDNSVEWYLASSTFVVIILQPWLMRWSRMVYLYLYVGFGTSTETSAKN